ncbi:MAG: hypothetical protein Q7W56_04505 [Candidatus Latescibacteria bacterium]|nr:hypothetical protein [Candidatus Latescibacterota bacterium]
MRNHTRFLTSLAAVAALVVMAGGCIFSPDEGDNPQPPAPTYPFADTPEKLMTNFKNAYGRMNVDEYRNVLHMQYKFLFADGSPAAPTEGYYTREQDLQSTTRMFNGEQGLDPDGLPKPGVRDIDFDELTLLTVWEDVPETDINFPGAIRALYDVKVVFYLDTEGLNTITVDSQQLFYLKSISEEQDDGSTRTHFYMIGQEDL